MDDRLKETLSAMMDDQADELSVRRLLSKAGHSDLRCQWQRWQQVRDILREDHVPGEAVDVSAQVRASLFGEPAAQQAPTGPEAKPGVQVSWRWSAVAMVALSLAVGFGLGAGWYSESVSPDVAAAGSVAVPDPVAAEMASQDGGLDVPEVALQGLDDEQWEHLSRYLLEHAQHNSVGAGRGSVGYARLASVSGPAR